MQETPMTIQWVRVMREESQEMVDHMRMGQGGICEEVMDNWDWKFQQEQPGNKGGGEEYSREDRKTKRTSKFGEIVHSSMWPWNQGSKRENGEKQGQISTCLIWPAKESSEGFQQMTWSNVLLRHLWWQSGGGGSIWGRWGCGSNHPLIQGSQRSTGEEKIQFKNVCIYIHRYINIYMLMC